MRRPPHSARPLLCLALALAAAGGPAAASAQQWHSPARGQLLPPLPDPRDARAVELRYGGTPGDVWAFRQLSRIEVLTRDPSGASVVRRDCRLEVRSLDIAVEEVKANGNVLQSAAFTDERSATNADAECSEADLRPIDDPNRVSWRDATMYWEMTPTGGFVDGWVETDNAALNALIESSFEQAMAGSGFGYPLPEHAVTVKEQWDGGVQGFASAGVTAELGLTYVLCSLWQDAGNEYAKVDIAGKLAAPTTTETPTGGGTLISTVEDAELYGFFVYDFAEGRLAKIWLDYRFDGMFEGPDGNHLPFTIYLANRLDRTDTSIAGEESLDGPLAIQCRPSAS